MDSWPFLSDPAKIGPCEFYRLHGLELMLWLLIHDALRAFEAFPLLS